MTNQLDAQTIEFKPQFKLLEQIGKKFLSYTSVFFLPLFALTFIFSGQWIFGFICIGLVILIIQDLRSYVHDKIVITNKNLEYTFKPGIFIRIISGKLDLRQVSKMKLKYFKGRYNLLESYAIEFTIPINKDEPPLYIEKKDYLMLKKWDNETVTKLINFIRKHFPHIIWLSGDNMFHHFLF